MRVALRVPDYPVSREFPLGVVECGLPKRDPSERCNGERAVQDEIDVRASRGRRAEDGGGSD